jgi:hypothetical protein
MKAHWSSTHGRQGQPGVDFKYASLQTFFKGNLLRYFTGGPAISEQEQKLVGGEVFKLRSQTPHVSDLTYRFNSYPNHDNRIFDIMGYQYLHVLQNHTTGQMSWKNPTCSC